MCVVVARYVRVFVYGWLCGDVCCLCVCVFKPGFVCCVVSYGFMMNDCLHVCLCCVICVV